MNTRLIKQILFGFVLVAGLNAQLVLLQPTPESVTALHHISVTVAGKAGAEVDLLVNGEQRQRGKVRVDGLLDFINVKVPSGEVNITVTAKGRAGRIYSVDRKIHVFGNAASILPYKADLELPADGKSMSSFNFEIRDEWGYRLKHYKTATVSLNSGTIVDPDIDQLTPGHQLALNDGLITINIRAASEPKTGLLEISIGGILEQIDIRYFMPQEPFILVGSFNSAFVNNGQDLPLNLAPAMNDDAIQLKPGNGLVSGRTAFYARGSLFNDYKLTASLDTDRGYQDQLFKDVDPNQQYPLYGDGSSLVYDVQTRSRLFAKVEKDNNFFVLGDFNTGLNDNEFTAYDRTLNGALTSFNLPGTKVVGFASLTDRKMKLDEIRGAGISGYYYLDHGGITRLSEKIRIITRDRHHSERILRTDELKRFNDYDINYVDGTIMFKQPVASIDGQSNPIFILVSYEYRSYNDRSLIGGLRINGQIGKKMQVGSTLIMEEHLNNNYLLLGGDALFPINETFSIKSEIGLSRNPQLMGGVKTGGAVRSEIMVSNVKGLYMKGYYRLVNKNFYNPSQAGSAFEIGSQKYGLGGSYDWENIGRFYSDLYYQQMGTGSDEQQFNRVMNVGYSRQLNDRSDLELGFERASRERTIANTDSSLTYQSNLLKGKYKLKLTKKITGSVDHQQNLGKAQRSIPTSTGLGLDYQLNSKLSFFWKYRLIQGSDLRSQSILGFDSKLRENTKLTGKYEIGGMSGSASNRASIGLNNKWQPRKDLTVNVAYEHTTRIDSFEVFSAELQALALSFEFLPDQPWKLVGKYEIQDNRINVKTVRSVGGNVRIYEGLGSIIKLNHYQEDFKSKDGGKLVRQNHQFGLTYRPVNFDFINSLFKLAYISEDNTHISPAISQQRMIAALHTYWQSFSWLGIGLRYARRSILDREIGYFNDRSLAQLVSMRAEINLSLNWSTSVDLRYLSLGSTGETNRGLAIEAGYLVRKNLQIGAGYIFNNYIDPDFSYLNSNFNNFYITLNAKFSEDIFNWR